MHVSKRSPLIFNTLFEARQLVDLAPLADDGIVGGDKVSTGFKEGAIL